MEKGMMVCPRCHARKKLYKVGAGYSHADMGGVLVTCPMCNGDGIVKTLEEATKEIEKKVKSSKQKEA